MTEGELAAAPDLITMVEPLIPPPDTKRFYTGFVVKLVGSYRGRGFIMSDVVMTMN